MEAALILCIVAVLLFIFLVICHTYRLCYEYKHHGGAATILSKQTVTSVDISGDNWPAPYSRAPVASDKTDVGTGTDLHAQNVEKAAAATTAAHAPESRVPTELHGAKSVDILQMVRLELASGNNMSQLDPRMAVIVGLVKRAHLLTYLYIISFMSFTVCYGVASDIEIMAFSANACIINFTMLTIFFMVSRLSLYYVFMARIRLTYDIDESIGRKKYYVLKGCTFVFAVCLIVLIVFYNILHTIYGSKLWKDTSDTDRVCDLATESVSLAAIGYSFFQIGIVLDIFIQIFYAYLFIKPLVALKDKKNNEEDAKLHLKHVMTKYALLTVFTVLTQLIVSSLFVFKVNVGLFLIVDGVMNALALLLMSSIHERVYKNMCCCCHNLIFNKIK